MIPRGVLLVAGIGYLLLPAPAPRSAAGVLAAAGLLLTLRAVLRPASPAVAGLLVVGVMEWLLADTDPGTLRAAAFGLTALAVHRSAALAAAVAPGAAVPARVLLPWAVRGLVAFGLGGGVVLAGAAVGGQANSAALVVVGLLAAGAALGLLALPAPSPAADAGREPPT